MSSPTCVKRITLFKVPDSQKIDDILAAYEVLRTTATKDGKPYVLSLDVGRVYNTVEERSQGYTIAVESTFATREDVEFYDKECVAHRKLKETTKVHQGLCTLLFDSERP